MPPCVSPLNPAATLALACISCLAIAMLVVGLLSPDPPMPPIRTAPNQTPMARPSLTTGSMPTFVGLSTPVATDSAVRRT